MDNKTSEEREITTQMLTKNMDNKTRTNHQRKERLKNQNIKLLKKKSRQNQPTHAKTCDIWKKGVEVYQI